MRSVRRIMLEQARASTEREEFYRQLAKTLGRNQAATVFEKSASRDKDYVVVEGAVHGFAPCTACETTPGQYANSVKNLFDYIRNWTNKRF